MNTRGYIYIPNNTRDVIFLTEHYDLKRRIDELHTELSCKKPDIFVSHRSEDKNTAEKVAKTIAKWGSTAYLDIWDHNVDGDGPELVDYIQSVIGCCNSLIVVFSPNTVRSWWVPLEIGIAITEGLYLGTFLAPTKFLAPPDIKSNFPSYLKKWPVLKNTRDLENWCITRLAADSTEVFYESLKRNFSNMFWR